MALTVTPVTYPGARLDFAGPWRLTGPRVADGMAQRQAVGGYPERLAGTGRGAGQPPPLRPPLAARPNPRPALADSGGIFGRGAAAHGAPGGVITPGNRG